MKQLKLTAVLALKNPVVISFFGGGGKTALIYKLAEELVCLGRKVLLTTTTKIFPFQDIPLFTANDPGSPICNLQNHFKNNNLAVYGRMINSDNKLEGINSDDICLIKKQLPVVVLVEADGSKGRPIKGYSAHEPAIPACSDLNIAVIGADALDAAVTSASVHRPFEFAASVNASEGAIIDEKLIANTFSAMLGLGRLQAPGADNRCVLNKADLLVNAGQTMLRIAEMLSNQHNRPEHLYATAALSQWPVKVILNLSSRKPEADVSAVVLAAGTATRMGEDKLLLPLGGLTILEYTLGQLAAAGMEDIIVVIRPDSPWPDKLDQSKYNLAVNKKYLNGMSSSLKTGLSAVNSKAQGVIFALGDQPLIPPAVYRELVESYNRNLKLITCPVYQGKRGNPTLFDRRTWPALNNLSGDRGGRSLFSKLPASEIDYVDTKHHAVTIDIDSPEDYRKLQK